MEGIPQCGDQAGMADHVSNCDEGDCCGSIREYFVTEAAEGKPQFVQVEVRHACEQTLKDDFSHYDGIICKDHENACYNVSYVDIPEHQATYAKVCFCEGDRCNNNVPPMPNPETTSNVPPTTTSMAPGTFHTCYNCGYRCSDIKDNVCKPEPIGDVGDVAFCGDVTSMESQTKECGGGDECCGSLKEYFEKTNNDGSKKIDMIAVHGCEKDLTTMLSANFEVICNGHENACYNISRENFQDETLTAATACFCDTDKCNNDVPSPPVPGSTTSASGTTTPSGPSKTCFNCGYKCSDMKGSSCVPEPIDTQGEIAFCGDTASMSSHTKECGNGDECCGALREYWEFNEGGGEGATKRVDMITFHGCEKDLAGALGAHYDIICNGHTNSCQNVSRDDIEDGTFSSGKACFCDGDRCNDNLPDLPFPDVPDSGTTTACPDCKECYNCGYMKKGVNGDSSKLPELPFCGDFAKPTDIYTTCSSGDCCASLKEYFIIVDEATGENSTTVIGRHGCYSSLDHLSQYGATCDQTGAFGNTCFEVDADHLKPDSSSNDTIILAEICLCDTDRCNSDDPIPPVPTTPAPASSTTAALATILLLFTTALLF